MKTLPIPAALLALASLASAQQGTSPAGFLAVEGDDNYNGTFGYQGANSTLNTYFTIVDATNTGPQRVFRMLSLRRDGASPTSSAFVARTVHMTIRMAHGDYAHIANHADNPDQNLLTSPWSTVFTGKTVNLPNWTTAPAGGTAPFDLQFPLDVVFPYNGVDAVVFKFRCTPSNLPQNTFFPIDAVEDVSYSLGAQTNLGTGCTATGRATPMSHLSNLYNYGPGGMSTWQIFLLQGPALAPMVFFGGASNPNAQVGACQLLFAWPTLVISAATDGAGFVTWSANFPHQDALIGANLFSQAIAYDAGQSGVPFALSNGVRATYPPNLAPTLSIASGSLRTSAANFPTSSFLFKGASLVIGLGY